jgi:hypothetical protein
MDLGDIQFRIGLIIAVLVLGSAFAGGLYLLIGENDEDDAKRTADTLGRALEALSPGSSSASLVIEFRSGQGEGIRVDPTLGGEYFTIHVLPEMIYIDWKGGREIVSEMEGIIPSYIPFTDEGDPIPVQGLGNVCRGFDIRTPCTIIVDQYSFNGSSFMMVHPPTEDWTNNASMFAQFLMTDSIPKPGSELRSDLELETKGSIVGRWLLTAKEEGSCPYPIWIPLSFHIYLPSDFGSVTARIRSTVTIDGEISISRTIS